MKAPSKRHTVYVGFVLAATVVFAMQTFDDGAAGYGRASDHLRDLNDTGPAPATVRIGTAAYYSSDTGPCEGARKAVRYYRAAYSWNRGRMLLSPAPPFVRYGCDATRRRALEWRARARQAKRDAERWLYDWRSWLPGNWYAVGSCETGYGGPPNWSHGNSSFVSAFGISVREYDADAAHMGARPWSYDNPPPPRHQYLAALGHYDRFGDGWSCAGP